MTEIAADDLSELLAREREAEEWRAVEAIEITVELPEVVHMVAYPACDASGWLLGE